MTIDDAILCLKGIKQYGSDTFTKQSQGDWQNSLNLAIDTMSKYQKFQDQALSLYMERLNADMVAMLTELQLEIEEVPKYCMTHDSICVYRKAEEYISDINNVIQQKINALKGEEE